MAHDGDLLDRFMTPGVTWVDIYTSLARHFYEEGDLGFLGLCRQRSPILPSWVPDWSQQQRPPWLGYSGDAAPQLYNAGRGTQAEVLAKGGDGRMLVLKGFIIDTLQDVGSLWVADLADDIDRFLSLSQNYVPQEARWRMVTADKELNDVMQPRRATRASQEAFTKRESAAKSYNPGEDSFGTWYLTCRNTLMSLYGSRAFISNKGTADLEDRYYFYSKWEPLPLHHQEAGHSGLCFPRRGQMGFAWGNICSWNDGWRAWTWGAKFSHRCKHDLCGIKEE
ncbi:hypothetical protein QBC40DRAFT_334056 [Triangularia verruculosa]|uniref:Uncharacterized protein n=1 Tax=Triangularia verruculosa TaxID=2587418 RepID=A0AAN6XBZ6_9PEZI|nr:hypothetical protein QBC40DRAFT_334056 [Triangularia verruculosa]